MRVHGILGLVSNGMLNILIGIYFFFEKYLFFFSVKKKKKKSSICKVNLEGQKFFFHDNELFCNDDYQRVFTCASCGLNIDDQVSFFLFFYYLFDTKGKENY